MHPNSAQHLTNFTTLLGEVFKERALRVAAHIDGPMFTVSVKDSSTVIACGRGATLVDACESALTELCSFMERSAETASDIVEAFRKIRAKAESKVETWRLWTT